MKLQQNRARKVLPQMAGLFLLLVWVNAAFGQQRSSTPAGTADFAREQIAKITQSAKTLKQLADQVAPANLPAAEQNEAKRFNSWLNDSSRKLNDLASRWQEALNKTAASKSGAPQAEKGSAQNLQEMSQSFNMQYLALQQNMQDESRRFTLVSNVLKAKHDTAKNAIGNVR
jgi:hypothetical protein